MAQIGSALPWGGRGRGFKSRHSDQHKPRKYAVSGLPETAYFFVRTLSGHQSGHHMQNDEKTSRFIGLANHISTQFQSLDACRQPALNAEVFNSVRGEYPYIFFSDMLFQGGSGHHKHRHIVTHNTTKDRC